MMLYKSIMIILLTSSSSLRYSYFLTSIVRKDMSMLSFRKIDPRSNQRNKRVIQLHSTHKTVENWPIEKVRQNFIQYFENQHNHTFYKSSPCVPVNDPTLLFANAGMNQFKPIFIGTVNPNSPLASLVRAVNTQKCIRAGGKHNDLDDVGKDTYHHTFFEMLGTWSFGNYFKKEAIEWAYDILVNTYKLDPNRLYASYFRGDESLGLPSDEEAKSYWLQFLPPERVLPFDKKANFWEMGDTGPCGPCSEIHYDRIGKGRDAASLVNADDPNVIEIWNLVFIQYNREPNGELRQLPNKHIDTGMGLERLTSILQDKKSNYDTDAFMPIFKSIESIIGCPAYTGKLGDEDAIQNYRDTAYRVIADHIRTLTFAITDGAVPSNEGRGYVLRRILRRAVRYGIQTLGAKPGFFTQLVPTVVKEMGNAFPELVLKEAFVQRIITEEEVAFSSLLKRGVKYFEDIVKEIKSNPDIHEIDGEKAFFMYDTLGFPIDLTQIMASENSLTVDMKGFHREMEIQKERSRNALRTKKLSGRTALQLTTDHIATLQKNAVSVTDDSYKYIWDKALQTNIQAVLKPDVSNDVALCLADARSPSMIEMNPDELVGIVLKETSYYPEAGGQVGDMGQLVLQYVDSNQNVIQSVLDVLDVQVYGGYVLHTCSLTDESPSKSITFDPTSTIVTASVDYGRRRRVAPNHTMTHVLNYALRKVLNDNSIDQKGSSVSEDKLRFDFSSNRGLQLEELQQVESIVNQVIKEGLDVNYDVVELSKALKIQGLRAVFGEEYPDPVRVISIGPKVDTLLDKPESHDWIDYSIEFCGGTHISNTKEAQSFVLLEETAIAKGIRRIVGVTGDAAKTANDNGLALEKEIHVISNSLKEYEISSSPDLVDSIGQAIASARKSLESELLSQVVKSQLRNQLEIHQKELAVIQNNLMMKNVDAIIQENIEQIKIMRDTGMQSAVVSIDVGSDAKAIKRVIEEVKKIAPTMSFLCLSKDLSADKLIVFAVVTPEGETKGLKANEWINAGLNPVGGKGGGKSSAAQGSVVGISVSQSVLENCYNYLNKFVSA